MDTTTPTEDATGQQAEQIQVPLPPAPAVADVPRGALPPAAVIGVLGVPHVLRASLAYQAADKIITERRQKMNDDAQKEQVKLRDMGQELATDRAKMTAEQVRAKEKDLQEQDHRVATQFHRAQPDHPGTGAVRCCRSSAR